MHLRITVHNFHYITDYWKFKSGFSACLVFAPFALSVLQSVAICATLYIALETALNGQYDFAEIGGLPQCIIAFTALYVLMEIVSASAYHKMLSIQDEINNLEELQRIKGDEDEQCNDIDRLTTAKQPWVIVSGVTGIIGNIMTFCMYGCAVAALLKYFNSDARMPCTLTTITEKFNVEPEMFLEIAIPIIVVLTLLWIGASLLSDNVLETEQTRQIFQSEVALLKLPIEVCCIQVPNTTK